MEFEDNIKKLENISDELENPNITMSEGFKLFEDGVKIAKDCYKTLNEMKGKITILKQDLDTFK